MHSRLLATDELVARYFELFLNRRAYTIQSSTLDSEKGRCYYYRPKGRVSLSESTLRNHLEGRITIGLYAINPATQRCKWVAIDADYSNALEDLLKLQWELRQDGVDAALEKSRRGGHLWIFAQQPLLARDCRSKVRSVKRDPLQVVRPWPMESRSFPSKTRSPQLSLAMRFGGLLVCTARLVSGTGSTAPTTHLKRRSHISRV